MDHILDLQQTPQRTVDRVKVRAIVRTLATEHTLALRAATKAASARQSRADVRAMYLSPLGPREESDVAQT